MYADHLPLNGVSLLQQVQVVGHDGDRSEALPPLAFGYSPFEPKGRDFFPVQGKDLPARALANPDLELADLFGRGMPDILEMNGTVRYWRNLGQGRFDLPREMRRPQRVCDSLTRVCSSSMRTVTVGLICW